MGPYIPAVTIVVSTVVTSVTCPPVIDSTQPRRYLAISVPFIPWCRVQKNV